MYLTYTQALVLKEIAAGKAELNANCEPAILYINGHQPGSDQAAEEAIARCRQCSLVDEHVIDGYFGRI
jgi:hypothetical protein